MNTPSEKESMTEGIEAVTNAIKDMCEAVVKEVDVSALSRAPIEKDIVTKIIEDEKASFEARLQEYQEAHGADRES